MATIPMHDCWSELRTFYDEAGIAVHGFRCRHADACAEAAAPRGLNRGAEAHVGSRYGTVERIVVVSLDTGHEPADLPARRAILESIDPGSLNRHMAGTTSILRHLLRGQIGDDEAPYSYFAMINAAKCSGNDGKRDMVPPLLYENCRGFALQELSILRPQIVVLQGVAAGGAVGKLVAVPSSQRTAAVSALSRDQLVATWLESLVSEYLRMAELQDGSLVVALHTPHPSARNGRWQVFDRTVLAPVAALAIRLARHGLTGK